MSAYRRQEGLKSHLELSPAHFAHISMNRFPMTLSFSPLEQHPSTKTLALGLDVVFRTDFLQWAKKRLKMETTTISGGRKAKGIKRLLEGIFLIGKIRAIITLKIFAFQRDPSMGWDGVEVQILDHISRIE